MSDSTKETKHYTNGEVTVVWQQNLCTHSANCVKGLPQVFDTQARPWINASGAGTQAIVDQVKKCPSGALTTFMNAEGEGSAPAPVEEARKVKVIPNGPLQVFGHCSVESDSGTELRERPVTSFCRCGASENKPFCDGSHKKIGFVG